MTIAWTGAGGAFTILGAYCCAMDNINGTRRGVAPSPAAFWGAGGPEIRDTETAFANIIAAHTAIQEKYYDGINSVKIGYKQAQGGSLESLRGMAALELIALVNADNPMPDLSLPTAMREFVRQFKKDKQTVLRCAVTQTVTADAGNIGNAIVLCSINGRFGGVQEYAYQEKIVLTCTGDADGNGNGGAAGGEPLTIATPAASPSKWDSVWPAGSGINGAAISVIDPNTSAGANMLTNSNFETFTTPNVPDNWTINVGVAGTTVKKDGATFFGNASTASLQLVGDAATQIDLTQAFGAATGSGTTAALRPATVYGINFNGHTNVAPAAGTLKLELVDGAGAIINDDQGAPNAISQTLSALVAGAWTPIGGMFRTPSNLPDVVKLRIRTSTPISVGTNLNLDFGAMSQPAQLYAGGPYVMAFRGSTDLAYGDRWEIAITNSRAGFQTFFEKAFDMTGLGLILPSAAAGNTIPEALIA